MEQACFSGKTAIQTGNKVMNNRKKWTIRRIKMLEKIKELAADSLGADVNTMTAETSFKEDLGADSLDLFEMVMALEEEFELEIPTEDLENIKTIGDVESYIQSRQ